MTKEHPPDKLSCHCPLSTTNPPIPLCLTQNPPPPAPPPPRRPFTSTTLRGRSLSSRQPNLHRLVLVLHLVQSACNNQVPSALEKFDSRKVRHGPVLIAQSTSPIARPLPQKPLTGPRSQLSTSCLLHHSLVGCSHVPSFLSWSIGKSPLAWQTEDHLLLRYIEGDSRLSRSSPDVVSGP